MDVDCYRLAYNTFNRNWQRFGIPEKDIPPPKTEKVDCFDVIIPGFSRAVVLFQIPSRSDLKTLLEGCPKVHNLTDFCTRFETTMKKFFPEPFVIIDPPKDRKKEGLPKVSMQEDQSENTMETDLSGDATEEDLSEDSKLESLPEDNRKESHTKASKKERLSKDCKKESHTVKEDISEDTMETDLSENTPGEDLSEESKKETLPEERKKESQTEDSKKERLSEDSKIKAEEVSQIIAFSLAICTELILYQYEDNKKYMRDLPDLWVKHFNENLKDLCDEAGCTSEMLKDYSESIRCPENFLNKFVTENKNEYHDILAKFNDYIQTSYAEESPEHSKFIFKVGSFPIGQCFARIKAQVRAFVERFKCVKDKAPAGAPPLDDSSPSTP